MSFKNRRSVKCTYRFDEMKWIIVRFLDDDKLDLVKGVDVENEETGENAQEVSLEEGDLCMAKWQDGAIYRAKVLFVGENKEEAMKNLQQLKKAYPGNVKKCADTNQSKDDPAPVKEKKANSGNSKNKTCEKPTSSESSEVVVASQPEKKRKLSTSEKKMENDARIEARHLMVDRLIQEETKKTECDWESKCADLEKEVQELRKVLDDKEKEVLNCRIVIRQLREEARYSRASRQADLDRHLASSDVKNFLEFLTRSGATQCHQETPPQSVPLSPGAPPLQRPTDLRSPQASQKTATILASPPPKLMGTEDQGTSEMVDLGRGVLIKKIARDNCLASANGQAPKLIRNLLNTFFDKEVLARSCARGSKDRPGLPSETLNAITGAVCTTRKFRDGEVPQNIVQGYYSDNQLPLLRR